VQPEEVEHTDEPAAPLRTGGAMRPSVDRQRTRFEPRFVLADLARDWSTNTPSSELVTTTLPSPKTFVPDPDALGSS